MSTTKKQIGMTILRHNNTNNESIDSNNTTTTPTTTNNNNNNKNATTSSCNSINNIINNRKNVYLTNTPTSKSLINSSNNNCNRNNKNDLFVKNTITTSNNNNNNNSNSAYLTTRRCLNKKSQLNINSNCKNSLNNNELENNTNNKNINSYINKLSLAINNKQIHKIEEEQEKQKNNNNFTNQHFTSFNSEKSKLEVRNNNHNNSNYKNPIQVSVLNSSNISRKVSKSSVENYLKPFYLNEFSKCEKENTTLIKTNKKNSIKELKISNITNIQASIERYETNQQQQTQDSQLDTPIIYLNSSLNSNFSLNRHNNNNNNIILNNSNEIIEINNNNNNSDKLKKNEKKLNRPVSINSLDNIKSKKNDSIESFDQQLKLNEINKHHHHHKHHNKNNQSFQQNMLSSQTNIVNETAVSSFRLTQSHKEKNSKSYTLKSNKSLASSSSSSQNLIASLNQNQMNKFIQTPTSKKSAFTSMKHNLICAPNNTNTTIPARSNTKQQQVIGNQEAYDGGLVEKMASFIDELKDFIDDRLIDTTSQLELANQRISGLYFNLNYLTSELINLKKQNEELKKEMVFKNNNINNNNTITRCLLKDNQYLDSNTYSTDYAKKIHAHKITTNERYIDSSCMKLPDSGSSNLETTMNNSTSKTSSPETTSASSTSTSTSLIISQTPLESLYIKKANTPPHAYHNYHHNYHHHHQKQQPKTSKDFKSGKHFEILNDLELKKRDKHHATTTTNNNSSKIQSSSSSINSINFYDNMSMVNRFEINWPNRSINTDTNAHEYHVHRTSSPSQIDINNLMQTQYASTDFDHDDIYETNDKNYEPLTSSQTQQQQSPNSPPSPDLIQTHANESLNFEASSSFSNINANNTNNNNKNDETNCMTGEKDTANDILLNQKSNLVHHLHASIVPYNNLIADFDTQYIWDYESNGLVNKYSEKNDNIKFQN